MDIFFEVHKNLPQEGPGSNESTRKALSNIDHQNRSLDILDIGCGPGRQTFEVIRTVQGHVIALDTHQPFLDEVNRQAKEASLEERVTTVNAQMDDLPFEGKNFDLIWSEGAIYIMGFDKGLSYWRDLLYEPGFIALTEISWLKGNIPSKPKIFWEEAYPSMRNVEENISAIQGNGYELLSHFVLPESDWWDNYYVPMERRIIELKDKYAQDKERLETLDQEIQEIDLYRNFSEYYGYVFYIMKKKE